MNSACRPRQKGLALLTLLAGFVLAGMFFFLRALNTQTTEAARQETTQRALKEAKAALIAYAAAHGTQPGALPCPANPGSTGSARSSCASEILRIGHLPWGTLNFGTPLLDGSGEQLWYAVSAGFRSSSAEINSETAAGLTLDGSSDKVVAIVFAPGPALAGQSRTSTTPVLADYLEAENANSGDGDTYVSSKPLPAPGTPQTFNDQALALTHDELFAAVETRVANEVRYALLEYFCGTRNNVDIDTPSALNSNHPCASSAGFRYFPRAARFTDSSCLGKTEIDPGCTADASATEGRIPANPTPNWTALDPLPILRGTTGGDPANWFQKNRWREMVYYAVAPACTEGTINCNGGTFLNLDIGGTIRTGVRFVVVVAGRPIASLGQTRTDKAIVGQYLEGQNATTGDALFVRAPRTGTFNDTTVVFP